MVKGIFWDCDGTLADTERHGHRIAYNKAFQDFGVDHHWDEESYGPYSVRPGGRRRFIDLFNEIGWPPEAKPDKEAYATRIHRRKSEHYQAMIRAGQIQTRKGVLPLIDYFIKKGCTQAVCSAGSVDSVTLLVQKLLGLRYPIFKGVFAGTMVEHQKPAPDIYLMALKHTRLKPEEVLVFEDTPEGLKAAKAAGLRTIVVTNNYTRGFNFPGAEKIVESFPDPETLKSWL